MLLIANVEKVFYKSPSGSCAFHVLYSESSFLPEPVISRWKTWITDALYYADNMKTDLVWKLEARIVAIGVEKYRKKGKKGRHRSTEELLCRYMTERRILTSPLSKNVCLLCDYRRLFFLTLILAARTTLTPMPTWIKKQTLGLRQCRRLVIVTADFPHHRCK